MYLSDECPELIQKGASVCHTQFSDILHKSERALVRVFIIHISIATVLAEPSRFTA